MLSRRRRAVPEQTHAPPKAVLNLTAIWSRAPVWVKAGLLAIAYAVSAKVGLAFASTDVGVTAVWPASGVALAVLLASGHRLWPGVTVGATLGSASLGTSLFAAGAEGIAVTAEALIALYLLRRFEFSTRLSRLRDVTALFVALPVAAGVSAAIGVGALAVAGIVPWSEYPAIGALWWIGDSLGMLVVAPLLFVWAQRPAAWPAQGRRVVELGLLGGLVLVGSSLLFGLSALAGQPLAFAAVPPVVWAALRFGPHGAVGVVAVISLFVVEGTARGAGPFGGAELNENLEVAQLFIAVLAGTGLSLAATIAERNAVTVALRRESATVHEQQRFLEATLENLQDAIVACDAGGRLTVFNRAARELHRLSAEPIQPEAWAARYSLYRPDGETPMPPEEIPLYRALRGEHVHEAELVVAPPESAPRRLVVSGQPIVSEQQTQLGAVVVMHDITERKLLEERLLHQALHDPLTGIANRLLFADRLQHALVRRGASRDTVAVLFLDLDDFKAVNDSLGHEAGDQLLIAVSRALEGSLRPADTVASLGGDEFAIVLEEIRDRESAARTAARILRAVRAPVTVLGRGLSVSASMGLAFATDGSESAEELMRNADLAMYRAKQLARGGHQVFDAGMHAAAVERLELKADLERAIQESEFSLKYQPIVNLETGHIVGVEALLRWRHPRRANVGPEEFIPLAEQTGLIVPLGRWALREACRQMARWQRAFQAAAPLTMSVNLSARQLDDGNLEADVAAALREARLPPRCLTLEMTESLLVEEPETAVARLGALKQLGVNLAIDDFGTGYSSLSYLTCFPIDVLKIDKSFVDRIDRSDGTAVARLVVDLGRALDLVILAEGVERSKQALALRGLGCELGQGKLFARPQTAASVARLLRRSNPHANARSAPRLQAEIDNTAALA